MRDYTVFRKAPEVRRAPGETNSCPSKNDRPFILCNGRKLFITQILFDAFRELPVSPLKYIWIDAICINQSELAERSAQVAIMGDIYRFAHSVTVWLGTEDERIRPALGTLRDFPRAHEEHLRQVGHNIDTVYEAATITELPISPPQAKTLACFFARAWFSRAWILQEIVVARGVLVFSGRLRSSWSLLTNASTHISRNQLGRVIARIATPDSEALVLHAGIVPYSVASYRETTMNGSMSFEQSLILTRSSECTDPRDRCKLFWGSPAYHESIERSWGGNWTKSFSP